jgi:type IV secretion system protein VirB8
MNTMSKAGEILEEELIYGARRRERLWQIVGLSGIAFGIIGCLSAAAVAVLDTDPPPVVVPYDPSTGMALPNASVKAESITERRAVIEAQVYRYVQDRETYNQLDNDIRVKRVLAQSSDGAKSALNALWSSSNPEYPPTKYGSNARLDVQIDSITLITNNRAQVRLRKKLTSPKGEQTGAFTATLLFSFKPDEPRSIDAVWQNPFGFIVQEYAIASDRKE